MTTDFIGGMRDIAAPELNFLLSEPPFVIDGHRDFGWFCREHAFCAAVVGHSFGVRCDIVRGDILVVLHGNQRLTSMAESADHVWCSTPDTPILDMSLHFRLMDVTPQLGTAICGLGSNGPFEIVMLPHDTTLTDDLGASPLVAYIPRKTVSATLSELVDNPQLLMAHDQAGTIACRVAIHTVRLLSGGSQPLAGSMSQRDALMRLGEEYPDAQKRVREFVDHRA